MVGAIALRHQRHLYMISTADCVFIKCFMLIMPLNARLSSVSPSHVCLISCVDGRSEGRSARPPPARTYLMKHSAVGDGIPADQLKHMAPQPRGSGPCNAAWKGASRGCERGVSDALTHGHGNTFCYRKSWRKPVPPTDRRQMGLQRAGLSSGQLAVGTEL